LDTEDYIPKYSAVIKLAQLIVVQETYKQQRETITYYESRGLSVKKAQDKADNHYMLTWYLVYIFITIAYDSKDPKPM
jgi:hypothetical protein